MSHTNTQSSAGKMGRAGRAACRFRRFAAAGAWVLLAALVAVPGRGQQPPGGAAKPPDEQTLRRDQQRLRLTPALADVFQKGTFADAQQRQALTQFVDLYFQRMRLTENVGTLTRIRNYEILKELRSIAQARSPEAHEAMVQMILQRCRQWIDDGSLPMALRYNAVLLLGDLNRTEPPPTGLGKAEPLPDALPLLLAIYRDASRPDALRVGALVGIARHAEEGIAERQRADEVRTLMLATLQDKTGPADRSPEAHEYLRRRAIDVLGALRQPGTVGEVPAALVGVLDDAQEPLRTRLAAARALGRLDYGAASTLNFSKIAHSLANLALVVAEASPLPPRDMLRYQLLCVMQGYRGPDVATTGGIEGVASGVHKTTVMELAQKVEALWQVVENPRIKEDELANRLSAEVRNLRTWITDNPLQNPQLSAR